MVIERFCGNIFAANTYVVFDNETLNGVVIDPSFSPSNYIRYIDENRISVNYVLLTHGHIDHIYGLKELKNKYGLQVCISEKDAEMLIDPKLNLGPEFGVSGEYGRADILLSDGDAISVPNMEFEVIETPGHTSGSVCFRCGNCLFTGDTLFNLSIGRTDLPGGSFNDMERSLAKLKKISSDLEVYPGHESSTSLSYEIDNNPFLINL